MNKLEIIRKKLKEFNANVFVSFSEQTRLWLSGMNTSAGLLEITSSTANLYLDGRYIEVGKNLAVNVEIIEYNKTGIDSFVSNGYKTILLESDYATIGEMNRIEKQFPNVSIKTISGQELRIIKTDDEVEMIIMANKIAMKALKKTKKTLKEGITEREFENNLKWNLQNEGATKESFDAIVLFGPNGSMPHGKPSDSKLKSGDYITVDFGAIYKGYCSDITRTWKFGEGESKIDKIHSIVVKAQEAGYKAVRPGVTTNEIDKVCRDIITEAGFGEYFVHSTGHGLGIDVHELPNVTANKELKRTLEPGMVITIEPGIYIPGVGGVRIEDDILVTSDGYKNLTR